MPSGVARPFFNRPAATRTVRRLDVRTGPAMGPRTRNGWKPLAGSGSAGCGPGPDGSGPKPLGKRGVATAGALGPDRLGQRTPATDQDHHPFGPGDGGVEQVALQHQPRAHGEGDDDAGVLAALGAVDADRIGMGQLIQLVEAVADLLVLIQPDPQLLVLEREGGDLPDRAVEHPGRALVIVVPKLHHLVAHPVDPPAEAPLRESLSRWS